MAFLSRLFGTKRPRSESQQKNGSERFFNVGKLIKETEHFLLLEIEGPTVAYVMLLREALVKQVVASSQVAFDEAAKLTAGQLFTLSLGPATKEDAVRRGAEISQKAWVGRYPTASAAAHIKGLPSSWDAPVVAVGWQR